MNHFFANSIIPQLIKKDCYLSRKIVAAYTVAAFLGLSIINLGEWQFYLGALSLVVFLIGMGNHLIVATIINEKKEQTLPFIMSLPISPRTYAFAKLCANMSIFIVPWLLILLSIVVVFLATALPNGFLPYCIILCFHILLNYCISWSAGMALQKEGVATFIMLTATLLTNPFMYFMGRMPGMMEYFHDDKIVWTATSIGLLTVEISAIIIILSITIYLQARKKVFL